MKNFVRHSILLGATLGVFASTALTANCYSPCLPSSCEWSACDGRFTLGADYLYWQTEQDGLPSIETGFVSQEEPFIFSHLKDKDPSFKYESGFRVYAGYALPCDQWELGAVYTYIPGKASVSHSIIAGEQAIDSLYTEFQGKWSSTFSYLDIDLARTLKFGECFALRPHMGFRAMWGDQKWHDHNILQEPLFNVDVEVVNTVPEFDKQKYEGYGVEGGLWAEWNVFCNFSVIGHFGGSVLYTKNSYHTHLIYGLLQQDGQLGIFNEYFTKKSSWSATPSLDYFLGLRYADCFCDWDFSAHIGWESHVWFDLGNVTLLDEGNFTTQGLTVGLDVSF